IHSFCFAISSSRNDLSGCVKSGEQHIIGITLPRSSTSFLIRIQFLSSFISIKPAYHSNPSISIRDARLIHSETFIVPSLQSACIKAFGNAANRCIQNFISYKSLKDLLEDCDQEKDADQYLQPARLQNCCRHSTSKSPLMQFHMAIKFFPQVQ